MTGDSTYLLQSEEKSQKGVSQTAQVPVMYSIFIYLFDPSNLYFQGRFTRCMLVI